MLVILINFFIIVDDFSRSVRVYLRKNKNEVPILMLNFFALIELQFGDSVKVTK